MGGSELKGILHALPLPAENKTSAVTWDKGCYLGQELTARTHFTGVTRKRLLPLRLCDEHVTVPPGSRIVNAKGRVVGRTRTQVGRS